MALAWGVGIVDSETIDEINILEATHLAMKKAIEACGVKPDIAMVDHLKIKNYEGEQFPLTHGDALSVSIGCGSIIAKVTRDRMMVKLADEYPGYGFEKHKGYGTKMHIDAIKEYGLCPLHRLSFVKNIVEN